MVVEARVLAPVGSAAARQELSELVPGFPSEEGCRAFLEQVRWPDGVRCPRCDASRGISRIESRGQFECDACGYQFSVLAGTALHASHLPLAKWFLAVHEVTTAEGHLSANQLGRRVGISYKTAWHLGQVIAPAEPNGGTEAFGDTIARLVGARSALLTTG